MDPRRLLIAALLVAAAFPGQAEVYKWVDENGKVTYTDTPPPGAAGRSEPVAVEEKISVMGMDPAIRAAAEHRFAQQALDEERDWQRRQQALYARQAVQAAAAPTVPAAEPYYPTYAPYYRAGYYYLVSYPRGPYYGRVVHRLPPRMVHHSPRDKHHDPRATGPSRSGPGPRTR
jgi:hypothetical protein